jgi:protein AFG1
VGVVGTCRLFLRDVPLLDTGAKVAQTRRFITLVDTLYDHHVKVICTASASPAELLDSSHDHVQETDLLGTSANVQNNQDEAFAFARTVSRLTEMQTDSYLQQKHLSTDVA